MRVEDADGHLLALDEGGHALEALGHCHMESNPACRVREERAEEPADHEPYHSVVPLWVGVPSVVNDKVRNRRLRSDGDGWALPLLEPTGPYTALSSDFA